MHIRHMESHLRRNINFPLIIVSGKYFDILSVFVISLPVFIRSTGLEAIGSKGKAFVYAMSLT